MKNSLLISLNSSGESLEKALSLYYYTLKENRSFYGKYNVSLFYGHNLPKNANQKRQPVHGTVAFYGHYYRDVSFLPDCSDSFLLSNKHSFLQNLLYHNIIPYRSYLKYFNDDEQYIRVIRNLPIAYLYPDYVSKIKGLSLDYLKLHSINNLYLEKNWIYYSRLGIPGASGCLYSLQDNGDIVHINCIERLSFECLQNRLRNSIVLSCNTSHFVGQVIHRIKPHGPIVMGYRQHLSQHRTSRVAINDYIKQSDSIIEPKNETINACFKMYSKQLNDSDIYAMCFLNYLKELRLKYPSQF